MSTNTVQELIINSQFINNTKMARVMGTKDIKVTQIRDPIDIKIEEDLISLIDLWTDNNVSISESINQLDMAVLDATYTLINNNIRIFTAEMIAKVLSGNIKQRITKRRLDTINRCLDKLRCIHIKIDATDEINHRKDCKQKGQKFVYESYLLPLDRVETAYSFNGKRAIAYVSLCVPAIYQYAERLHQIINIPPDWLETQDLFSDTDEAILIKRYVLKRVMLIKTKNKLDSNKISFKWKDELNEERGLYAELGYTPSDTETWRKTTKPMINRIVRDTLTSLVNKGVISSFKEYRESGNNPASPIKGYKVFWDK